MKRVIAVFGIIAFVVSSLAGCKTPESSANGNTPVPEKACSQTIR